MAVNNLRNAEIDEDTTIVIVGLGALGSNILESVVKMGFTKIICYDHDIVEEHNISSTIYNNHMVGMLKIDACSKIMQNRYGINITASTADHSFKITTEHSRKVIVIGCLDNVDSRISLVRSIGGEPMYESALFIDARTSVFNSDLLIGSSCNGNELLKQTEVLKNIEGDSTGLNKGCGTKVVTLVGTQMVNAMVCEVILRANNAYNIDPEKRGKFRFNHLTKPMKYIMSHAGGYMVVGPDMFNNDEQLS